MAGAGQDAGVHAGIIKRSFHVRTAVHQREDAPTASEQQQFLGWLTAPL